ncbi:S-methyl-5'-thioinosine phosphorylase [Jeongeupia chitinilytica]|uniref:Probable 6-oxopurine nucleoside phosphorylase n=1 Tax=Jeongeupia chitinilytica TaxID=1041641 RepID=A0ABQ3H066_9NEIS|nr:S-methyl-5'-thioinosine phosphorylase [Jeongeupia chitinilytica]GHD61107.1 S-methyl-5'-thioinosine phosphorylase [Jeongeupia chitinilytica]
MLAIIGGTGAASLAGLTVRQRLIVRTPYGDPSGPLIVGELAGGSVLFLARHGYGHTIPPHRINYRANIWALASQGAEQIVGLASVGGIGRVFRPGVLVLPDQLLDYTWGRRQTFFDGDDRVVSHVDFTEPYAASLREPLLEAARVLKVSLIDGGVYACMQGPRLETAAEIRRIRRDGGDMVGMTAMPEAVLARELGAAYATLAVVANRAAGVAESAGSINQVDATQALAQGLAVAAMVFEKYVSIS